MGRERSTFSGLYTRISTSATCSISTVSTWMVPPWDSRPEKNVRRSVFIVPLLDGSPEAPRRSPADAASARREPAPCALPGWGLLSWPRRRGDREWIEGSDGGRALPDQENGTGRRACKRKRRRLPGKSTTFPDGHSRVRRPRRGGAGRPHRVPGLGSFRLGCRQEIALEDLVDLAVEGSGRLPPPPALDHVHELGMSGPGRQPLRHLEGVQGIAGESPLDRLVQHGRRPVLPMPGLVEQEEGLIQRRLDGTIPWRRGEEGQGVRGQLRGLG